MRKAFPVFLAVLLLAVAAATDEKYADLRVVVVKDSNGKPVRNASVVLHTVNKEGKQEKGGLQLKTDADGKASFNSLPYGKLRVQVIAPGFQTFGEDFDIAQPTLDITVKMKRPREQ